MVLIVSAAKQHMYPAAEVAELGVKLVSLSKGDVPDPAPTEGDINLSIGRRIRRRRKLLGMTQGDLAYRG